MSSVIDLINAIEAGKTRECETSFEALIHAKIAEKMEERRAEISTSMFESAEQLDELSKDTLGAYVKKASRERGHSGLEAGSAGAGSKEQKDAVKTMKKRQAGVVKAVDRLTKESEELDEEQIDESESEQKLLDLAKYAKKDKESEELDESCDVKLVDSDEDLDQQIYHFNVEGKKVTFTYWDYDEEFLPDTHEITSQVKKQLGKLTSAQQSAVVKAVIDDLKNSK
jgi:hypothetical protein